MSNDLYADGKFKRMYNTSVMEIVWCVWSKGLWRSHMNHIATEMFWHYCFKFPFVQYFRYSAKYFEIQLKLKKIQLFPWKTRCIPIVASLSMFDSIFVSRQNILKLIFIVVSFWKKLILCLHLYHHSLCVIIIIVLKISQFKINVVRW